MSETTSHRRAKARALGRKGKTEQKIKYGGRIDGISPTKAIEVERGGRKALLKAIRRLERSRRYSRILRVPQRNFPKALEFAKRTRKRITVTNLRGSKRRTVR